MSRSNLVVLRNLLIVGACGVAGYFAWKAISRVMTGDPLAEFRGQTPQNEDTGVEMTNFDWKAYKGAALVAEGHVARAELARDRDVFQLTSVNHGKYYDDGKQIFGFQTQSAVYYNDTEQLKGTGKTRVFSDQMDITSAEFNYDPKKKALIVPTALIGKLQGGDLKAQRLTYRLEDKSFEMNGILWSGMVSQDNTRRKWRITSPDDKAVQTAKTRGAITTYSEFKATDGEIIVVCDGGEYNKDTDVLIARGHVKYFGSDANIACNEATIYRKEKRVILVGAVDMLLKPKQGGKPEQVEIPPVTPVVPEKILSERPKPPQTKDDQSGQEKQLRTGENIRDYPIAVTAAKVEYWYGKGSRRATITGSPQARQEFPDGAWRMVWAHSAFYDGEKETLDLKSKSGSSDVRMVNSLGDDMDAVSVLVSTKEGDDMMDATGVKANVVFEDEDLPKKEGGTGGDGGTPPPITGSIRKRG